MNIQEVAERTGVSAHTIRFYEKRGVLPPIQRKSNGIRQFSPADVAMLEFLLELKRTGMSLEEMTEFTSDGCILDQLRRGDIPVQSLQRRVALLQRHQQRLIEQRQQLDHLLGAVRQKLRNYSQYLDHKAGDE
jgi:DNA-binding transcriptional MerR regulator